MARQGFTQVRLRLLNHAPARYHTSSTRPMCPPSRHTEAEGTVESNPGAAVLLTSDGEGTRLPYVASHVSIRTQRGCNLLSRSVRRSAQEATTMYPANVSLCHVRGEKTAAAAPAWRRLQMSAATCCLRGRRKHTHRWHTSPHTPCHTLTQSTSFTLHSPPTPL